MMLNNFHENQTVCYIEYYAIKKEISILVISLAQTLFRHAARNNWNMKTCLSHHSESVIECVQHTYHKELHGN